MKPNPAEVSEIFANLERTINRILERTGMTEEEFAELFDLRRELDLDKLGS